MLDAPPVAHMFARHRSAGVPQSKSVQKSFAIQAGREVRIIVDSGKIGDEQAIWLSKDIAKRIEAELTYPGEIRVTVIRETRAVEFAR